MEQDKSVDRERDTIGEYGAAGLPSLESDVCTLSIIGQIEGHQILPETAKTTKYEHVLPLLAATGAGANGSRSLAACVVGGLLLGSMALLFLVPALFVVFQWAGERWMPRRLMDCPEAREERP